MARASGLRAAVLGTTAVGGAAVVALDDSLGFVGHRLLGPEVGLAVATATAVLAAVCSTVAVHRRRLGDVVIALAVLVYVSVLTPVTATPLPLPVAIGAQSVVPLGLLTAAVRARRSAVTSERWVALVVAVLASAWVTLTLVPLLGEVFVALQAATFLSCTVLVGWPVLERGGSVARFLWDSARVR